MPDVVTDALIAIAFALFVLLVVVPIIGIVLVTIFDIVFRLDIGFSRLVWLGAVLMVPGAGLLMYWLLRPKDFNPLLETREAAFGPRMLTIAPSANGRVAAAPPSPIRTAQPSAAEATEEGEDREAA